MITSAIPSDSSCFYKSCMSNYFFTPKELESHHHCTHGTLQPHHLMPREPQFGMHTQYVNLARSTMN